MPVVLSRRAALGSVLAAAGASCGPADPREKARTSSDSGGPAPGQIDHIIIVMMENRSFDHYLGARALVEGRTDEDGLRADLSNPTAGGEAVTPFASAEPCVHDPPHSWGSSHDQWNEGANDGFVRAYANSGAPAEGRGAMAYQQRADLPITWALADNFCVADRYFCSVMGPTWPNRLYGHMASSQGKTNNSFPGGSAFTEKTVWKALEEAGLEWGYYYADLPYIGVFADHWNDTRVFTFDRFAEHVANGRLAPVVWIDPAFSYNDNHPPHHPGLGELFLAGIYEALASSPIWERCLLILTYDEHGGFFDHVPPPTTDDDRASDGFDQLGFRVPTLFVGPWVKQGVDHSTYDHTSWIKYVCERFGLEPWNRRLQAAQSIAGCLDVDRMARGEPLPAVPLPAFVFDESAVGPECFYSRTPAHLEALAERARDQGIPVVFPDPVAARAPFLAEWRRRGLIT